MPSSLIWVALVAGWILVLFPMISGSRMPVSRTGAATEETRVLHRGGNPRPVRRGPATGHLSDPEWQPSPEEEQARRFGTSPSDPKTTRVEAQMDSPATPSDDDVVVGASDGAAAESQSSETVGFASSAPRVLDAVVVGEEEYPAEEYAADMPAADFVVAEEDVAEEDVAEEDTAEEDSDMSEEVGDIRATVPQEVPVERAGRGGFDPEADAAARAIRYRNRQRTMLGLAGLTVVSIIAALIFSSLFAWGAAVFGLLFVAYMSYMRQQVRMEQQIRERRMARLQRSRRDAVAERRAEHTVPGEARRYGAVVLETDDEDPAFEHLPHYESTVRSQETRVAG